MHSHFLKCKMQIKSLKRLQFLIGYRVETLKSIAGSPNKYYQYWQEPKVNKDGTPKIKGGEIQYRDLCTVVDDLEDIQNRILKTILNTIPLKSCVKGGIKRTSNIDNANYHKGKKYHFCIDLKDFFPSISNRMVYNMLVDVGFSADVSSLLTKLTTINGNLPQGTHTSTAIANLVFSSTDKKLINLFDNENIIYTRWVDDLTFSSQIDFHDICNHIVTIIISDGYLISHRKTYYKIGPVKITGIITKNNILKTPKEIKNKLLRSGLTQEQKDGIENYIKRVEQSQR